MRRKTGTRGRIHSTPAAAGPPLCDSECRARQSFCQARRTAVGEGLSRRCGTRRRNDGVLALPGNHAIHKRERCKARLVIGALRPPEHDFGVGKERPQVCRQSESLFDIPNIAGKAVKRGVFRH